MAQTFDLQLLAADPYADGVELAYLGARIVDLDTLMRSADFVVVCSLLDSGTRHLIGARELALMKPGAYLINVARGPVVDEAALIDVLARGAIGGVGVGGFETEPVDTDNPL